MTFIFAAFGPASKETAIFLIAAVVCFALAAVGSSAAKRLPGGALGLIALGLGLWLFPAMWTTVDVAF
jgi:hypothetical protein